MKKQVEDHLPTLPPGWDWQFTEIELKSFAPMVPQHGIHLGLYKDGILVNRTSINVYLLGWPAVQDSAERLIKAARETR